MSSACKSLPLSFALFTAIFCASIPDYAATQLRVCADPNDLPYSNDQLHGFENQIAKLIASDLEMEVSYFWYPQREKFFLQTLKRDSCDVVMGVPSGFEEALTTRPYYRSSYVFVSRHDRNLRIHSFDDPRLKMLSIGVHVLGDREKSQPPVFALTSRGIVRNLVGFNIFGTLYETNPAADLINAVSDKKVDVAVVWGPLAGYFTQHSEVPLDITPIADDSLNPSLPLSFDIGMGVRKGNTQLQKQLDAELIRRKTEIDQILRTYGIPESSADGPSTAKSASVFAPHPSSRSTSLAQEEK
jgi:quinoprotein dehydrogenase-associated probable ABC transporter substrate-binding protein